MALTSERKAKLKAFAREIFAGVEAYTARALEANLRPLEQRLAKLEASAAEIAALKKRNADLERQLSLFSEPGG